MSCFNKKIIILLTTALLAVTENTLAQTKIQENNSLCNKFSSEKLDNKQETKTTETNVAVAQLTVPSLWWAREQFDPFGGRLISNWLTNSQIKQIDLTVNWQLWTLLDYLGRYRFINQFGTVARENGYNLRIFNQQKQCLGTYQYNKNPKNPKWEIELESPGKESLQIESIRN